MLASEDEAFLTAGDAMSRRATQNVMHRSARGAPPGEAAGTVWSRIEQALAADIASGRARPGERLPGEHELAARFGVNRHTVRQAIASLAARGLVQTLKGRGSFVAEFALDYAVGRRTRFTENMRASGVASRRSLIEAGRRRADATLAARLRLPRGSALVWLRTLSEARGRPVSTAEHWLPSRRFAGIGEAFSRLGSLTRAYAEFGVEDFTRSTSWVTARLPDAETARRLRQADTLPVLHVESVNVDVAGRPIECCRTDFAADRVQLVFEPGG